MPIRLAPYVQAPLAIHPWDPSAPEIAALLAASIREIAPDLIPEHIGSSSVPGLHGKGYIDLHLAVPAERIPELTDALVAAGWQRQTSAHAFPPTRPMLRAALEREGRSYLSHLHIIPAGDPELAEQLSFRDALRSDPELAARYEARKREILAAGITEGIEYAIAKGDLVVGALRRLGLRPLPETGFTEILTGRLRLRRFHAGDLDAFVAYRDDEDTARYQGWARPFTRERGEAFLEWAASVDPDTPGEWFQYAVERRDEPGLLGDVAAHVCVADPSIVEIGVTFAPEHRGRGFAAEALGALIEHLAAARGKRRFEARCVIENAPVLSLLERLGFVRAGTRPAGDGFTEHHYVLEK